MEILIREAVPDDSQQLIAYVQALAAEPDSDIGLAPGEFNLTVDEEREILRDFATSDNSVYLVAVAGAEIVGGLNLKGGARQATHHTASLGISVKKGWRDQGIGRRLMEHIIEWAQKTTTLKRIELYVFARNERAIHLYQQFGFEIEGRRRRAVYRNGQYLDDYLMARLL